LEKIGLNLPAGRRKAANVTLLTSLVEGEHLTAGSQLIVPATASGFTTLLHHMLPDLLPDLLCLHQILAAAPVSQSGHPKTPLLISMRTHYMQSALFIIPDPSCDHVRLRPAIKGN
jgi:hypothetical protein